MKRFVARLTGLGILLLVLVALVLAGKALVRKKERVLGSAPPYATRATPVHVAEARLGDLRETRSYLAVVSPVRVATVSARLTSTVERTFVDEGASVSAGDALLVLDGAEIRDEIDTVESRIKAAGADLAVNEATVASLAETAAYWQRETARDRELVEKGDIPSSQAEATADKLNELQGRLKSTKERSRAIEHEREALKKQRAALETRLGYCTVRSPYDGIVTRRLVDPGDLAAPGKALIVVEDRSRLKAEFDVPQADLPGVREGLPVLLGVGEEERRAVLSHLYPSLNASRTLRAEVSLDEPLARGLLSGAYVPLRVLVAERKDVTLVPAAALVESPGDQDPYVFVVEDDRLRPAPVKLLSRQGEQIAVEGIAPGTRVVTSTFLGWARLAGGLKVEAIR